jgi:K+-sensing histidine kinase KdpD
MLVICPQCNNRYEIQKSNQTITIPCDCGENLTVLPWLSYRQVMSEQKRMNCPLCSREYNLSLYRTNTEIACNCGNLLVVQYTDSERDQTGRRKTDHDSHLRQKELHGLIDTSRLIHSAIQDLNALLKLIVRVTTEMLGVEGISVVLYDAQEDNLVFNAVTGEKSSELSSFRLNKGEGIAGSCIANRSTIIVNDVQNDARFSQRADRKTGFSTRSILCVPLVVENECIGAIEAVNKKNKEGFGNYDVLLAEAVASQIAVAVHNVRLHEEALKSERLAAIGEAITSVAHCVKNMLMALNGGFYIIQQDLKKSGQDSTNKGFEILQRNMNRLTDLVQDMLTYSKDREPEYEKTDINNLVESVVELVRAKAGDHGVALSFKPAKGIGEITIDPKGIYRSVLNILSNAIDASQEKDNATVTVETKTNDAKEVVIEIEDQGCGMDEDTMQSIFQPFYSCKGSKGTGLGLSVTKKIIEEHGGRISVSSKIGKGSVFALFIPQKK